jgi:hypothetical protein
MHISSAHFPWLLFTDLFETLNDTIVEFIEGFTLLPPRLRRDFLRCAISGMTPRNSVWLNLAELSPESWKAFILASLMSMLSSNTPILGF